MNGEGFAFFRWMSLRYPNAYDANHSVYRDIWHAFQRRRQS
jgi:hypothetical protein